MRVAFAGLGVMAVLWIPLVVQAETALGAGFAPVTALPWALVACAAAPLVLDLGRVAGVVVDTGSW